MSSQIPLCLPNILVFSKYPFWWDRVGTDFSGRVPGYSRRWAIIGDGTKISTFTYLKITEIMKYNHLLYFSSATFFAFKTVRHRRNINQEKISVYIQNTVVTVSIKVESHDLSVKHLLLFECSFGIETLFFLQAGK